MNNGLHEKILNLLHEIDRICRKYNITYYAAGGTTIGAVRHRGFIPWDDDADLYMTRDEFYRFREAFKQEMPKGRVLGCLDDNKEYPGTIPRYIDDETTFIARYHCMNPCAEGVVIDIFILDPVPSDPELQKEHIGKLNIYADFIMPYYGYTNRANDKFLDMYFEYKERASKEGTEKIIAELENELFTMKEEDCEYYILRWGTIPHIFEKSMFGKPVYFPYEDMEIPCPERWYDYLVMLYGPKWMYIPPHIEDEAHVAVIDCNHRYTNYIKDADYFIPKEEAYEIYMERKDLMVEKERLVRPLKKNIIDVDARYILRSQRKYLENNNIDISKLLEEKKYGEIVSAYKTYLDMQFSVNFVGKMNHANTYRFNNKIFIPLPDAELEILLKSLVLTGAVKRARDLINLRKMIGKLTAEEELIEQRVILIYEFYKSFYIKDYVKAIKLLGEITDEEKMHIGDISKLAIEMDMANNVDSLEIQKKIDAYDNSSDGEIVKIQGDLYYRDGDYTKAKECYKQAIPMITNGLMMLDISDKFDDLELNYDTPIDITQKTKLQEKQFELLGEIDDICKANDIKYYVIGNTLLFGYYKNVFGNEYTTNTIAMTPEDAMKFIEYCEQNLPDDRNIDYMLNNDLHNGHTIYYCDKNTLSLDWRKIKESRNIGIHITIYILKKKDKNLMRWVYTRGLDATQSIYNRTITNKYKKKSKVAKLVVNPIVGVLGEENIKKTVFNSYIKGAISNPERDYYLSKNNYKRSIGKFYDKDYFSGDNTITIYDREFSAPNNIEDYIYKIHGKYVAEHVKVREHATPLFKVADCNLVFDDIKDIVDGEIFTAENFDNYKRGTALNPRLKKLNKKVRKYWNILLRSEDRIKLYLKYMPLKEKIMELHREKNYVELEKILTDYDKCARTHINRKLALVFDMDIFQVYYDLLVHNGEEELAEKIKKNIPEEHKEKIVIQ